MNLQALREENARVGIGPELVALIHNVVVATAPQYPAVLYSKSQSWDADSLDDLAHDWVEARLIRRGDLAAMLAAASEFAILRKMLTRSLSQFIINQRRRTSASNLFKRARAMLGGDSQFRPVPPQTKAASRQLWTLAKEGSDEPSQSTLGSLAATTHELTDDALDVIRYGPSTLKSSPILRDPALRQFLSHLLANANGAVSLGQIAEVLSRRFNLVEFESRVLDETVAGVEIPPSRRVEIDELVRSVVANLGFERIEILREFHRSDGSVAATAKAVGRSKAEVTQSIKEVMAIVAEFADSFEEARTIYERTIESLF